MFTKEELEEEFIYDEMSPTCLRWKRQHDASKAGDIAGYVPSTRATPHIFYRGMKVSNALIVWILHGRTLSKYKALSPIDGDLTNVRFDNLQEVILYPYTL